ncbi:MAG: DUF2357 domain-containing protein [Candidatus Hydrothermales bacterium]
MGEINIKEIEFNDFKFKRKEGVKNEIEIEKKGEILGTLKGKIELVNLKNYPKFSNLWIYEFESSNGWELDKFGNTEIVRDKNNNKITKTKDCPFKNYIGKSEIILKKNSEKISIPVEVISKKLKTEEQDPLFYPKFYKNIVSSIWEHIAALPFDIISPTFAPSSYISSRHSTPLFTFFFLKNNKEELKSALNLIRANPYRILKEEKEFVEINKVSEIDADTIYNILTNPQFLYQTESYGFEVEGKYYAPIKVLSPLKYESLDNSENRFILYFLKILSQDIENLFTKIEKETFKEIIEIKGLIDDFLKDPLWEEVGELYIFPQTSTVLRMRDGYRELFTLYLKYLFASKPFERIEEAINLRKVYELYEFWCALELCNLLNAKEIKIIPQKKIPENFRLNFKFDLNGEEYELESQYTTLSYSTLPLRPDFSIYKNKNLLLILDAKFAFEYQIERDEKDEYEEAEKEGEFPKTGNIIKMYAYKDALKTKACIILYPGKESNFYKENGENKKFQNLKEYVEEILKNNIKGIGWCKMLPEKGGKNER